MELQMYVRCTLACCIWIKAVVIRLILRFACDWRLGACKVTCTMIDGLCIESEQ